MVKDKTVVVFSSSEDIMEHFNNYRPIRIDNINDLTSEDMKNADLFVIDVRNGEKIHLIDLMQLTYANQWCPVAIYEPDSENQGHELENKTLHFMREKDGDKEIQEKTDDIIQNNNLPPSLEDVTKMLFLDRIKKNKIEKKNKQKRKRIYA